MVRIEGISVYFRIQVVSPIRRSGFWKRNGKILSDRSEYSLKKKVRKDEESFGFYFEAEEPGQPIELHIGFSTRNWIVLERFCAMFARSVLMGS